MIAKYGGVRFVAGKASEDRYGNRIFTLVNEFNRQIVAVYRKRYRGIFQKYGVVFKPSEIFHLIL